jgi:hypothetical protein
MHGTTIKKYIILVLVLYGFQAWSLTLKKENIMGVLENRVLRKIFGPTMEEVTGKWWRMYDLRLSLNILAVITSKVNESRNRPGVAQRVPGGLGSQICMTFGTGRW